MASPKRPVVRLMEVGEDKGVTLRPEVGWADGMRPPDLQESPVKGKTEKGHAKGVRGSPFGTCPSEPSRARMAGRR